MPALVVVGAPAVLRLCLWVEVEIQVDSTCRVYVHRSCCWCLWYFSCTEASPTLLGSIVNNGGCEFASDQSV